MCLVDKAKNMLKWLKFTEEFIEDLFFGRTSLDIAQIDQITSISDAFQDDDVDIDLLENFLKIDAFKKLKALVQSKKMMDEYACGQCKDVVITNAVECDSCLIWYHYSCVGIDGAQEISQLQNNNWYCVNCVQIN